MSSWTLNLWPTNRIAKNGIDLQLDYQWALGGNPSSVLPPVIEVGPEGEALEVYFSFSFLGSHEPGIQPISVEIALDSTGDTVLIAPLEKEGRLLPAGCSWQVPLAPLLVKEEAVVVSFTVTVTATLDPGGPQRYSVDPEMVIQPTGKPRPERCGLPSRT